MTSLEEKEAWLFHKLLHEHAQVVADPKFSLTEAILLVVIYEFLIRNAYKKNFYEDSWWNDFKNDCYTLPMKKGIDIEKSFEESKHIAAEMRRLRNKLLHGNLRELAEEEFGRAELAVLYKNVFTMMGLFAALGRIPSYLFR